MPPSAPEPEDPRPARRDDYYFLKLWLVVSALWTAATLLRVARLWGAVEGWSGILGGPWIWLELVLPPIMFGAVIFAVRQIADNQQRVCSWSIWRRR
jgi:hypothetical protein